MSLICSYSFQLLAQEIHGVVNSSVIIFLSYLDKQLGAEFGDSQKISFLFQWMSLVLERFNVVIIISKTFFDVYEEPDL